jgi:hypothetical protein
VILVRQIIAFLYVIPLLPFVEIMEEHVATEEFLEFSLATIHDPSGIKAIGIIEKHPELLKNRGTASVMLERAVSDNTANVVEVLLKRGVHAGSKQLFTCASQGYLDIAKLLCKHGADPNPCRPIIAAMTSGGGNEEMIQLLLDHGADINRLFAMFGNKKAAKTALDFASEDLPIYKFLRDRGAKHVHEVLAENPNAPVYDD